MSSKMSSEGRKGTKKPTAATSAAASKGAATASATATKSATATTAKAAPKAEAKKRVEKPKVMISSEERNRMIAEAAYFIAEKRGFQGGNPDQDWLAAAEQIDRMIMSMNKTSGA